MKLRLSDSFLLMLIATVIILIGAGLIVLGLQTGELAVGADHVVRIGRWPLLAGGLALLLSGAFIFSLPQRNRRRRHEFVVQQTASGELSISLKALENLVRKTVAGHPEIALKGMDIRQQKDGVIVALSVALAGNVNIPLAVDSLQKSVKQQLLAATGVDVKEVKVTVETADSQVKDSPFLVREAPPVDAEDTESEAKDEARREHEER